MTSSTAQSRKTTASAAAVVGLIAIFCVLASSAQASTLFAGNQTPGSISALQVSSAGQISPVPGSPFPTSQQPRALSGSPNGANLYAGHRAIDKISQYAIGAGGGLSTIGPDLAFTPLGIAYPAFSPDARYVYWSSATNDAGLQYFSVGAGGTLAAAGTAPLDSNGSSLAITPDGRFLYACTSIAGMHAFSLDANGAPSGLPGFPKMSISCSGSAITPDGRFLVTSQSGWGVRVYSIGASGDLTQVGNAIMTGPNPNHVEISPDGTRVYVLNIGAVAAAPNVAQFALSADGAITVVGENVVLNVAGVYSNGLAVSPDGRFLAASNPTASANVHLFSTNGGGQLTPVPGSPFDSGANMGGGSPLNELAFRTNQGPRVSGLLTGGNNRVRAFTAVDATDSDGTIASYVWNFGDGSTATTATPNTTHTYAKGGDYFASVRVIDDENCSAVDIFDGRKFLCKASAAPTATQTVDALPPSFSKLKFTKKSVAKGGKAKLKYRLSVAATVKVTFQTRRGKGYKNRGSITFKSKAGSRTQSLKLRIKKRNLPAGSYRVLIVGTDAAKNTSSARRLKLKVR